MRRLNSVFSAKSEKRLIEEPLSWVKLQVPKYNRMFSKRMQIWFISTAQPNECSFNKCRCTHPSKTKPHQINFSILQIQTSQAITTVAEAKRWFSKIPMAFSPPLMKDRSRVQIATILIRWQMCKSSIFTIRRGKQLRTTPYWTLSWRHMKWFCQIRSSSLKKLLKTSRQRSARITLPKWQMNVGRWSQTKRQSVRSSELISSTTFTVSWSITDRWTRQTRASCLRT